MEGSVHIVRENMEIHPYDSNIPSKSIVLHKLVLSGSPLRTKRVISRNEYKVEPGSVPYFQRSSPPSVAENERDSTPL